MKSTGLFTAVLILNIVNAFGQIPQIRNAKTGQTINLMKSTPVAGGAKANKNAPVSSTQFPISGGGTLTVQLLKGMETIPYKATVGTPLKSQTSGQTCESTVVNAELSGIDAANLNPTTEAIFPGAIIDGKTVPTGEYRQITAARNPIVLSMSSSANGFSKSVAVNQPTLATVRDAVRDMLGIRQGGQFQSESETSQDDTYIVRSQEDVMLALNVHAKSLIGSVNFNGKFTEKANQITITRVYKQRYFSVDVIPPVNDVDFFQDAGTALSPDWTYVSSVKYGRIGILSIVVTTKSQKIDANLKAKIITSFSAKAGLSAEVRNEVENIEIKFFRYGGADQSITAGRVDEIPEALKRFNAWVDTGNTKPVPLSYTLRFVKYENGGPAVASINSTLKFTEKKCYAPPVQIEATLKEIKCIKSDDGGDKRRGEDLVGRLTAKAFDGGNKPVKAKFDKKEIVWEDKSKCGTSVRQGNSIRVDQTRIFDFDPADKDARIEIGGDLDDDDNCKSLGNDDEYDDQNGVRSTKNFFVKDIGTSPQEIKIDHKHINPGAHVQQVWVLKRAN